MSRKVSVSITDDAARAIEDIASERGISVSEAIRRGIAIEKFISDEISKGSTFLVRRKDGETERLQFVWS